MSAVRRILEEELMDMGVVVDSPCIDHKQPRLMIAENIRSIMLGEDFETSPMVSTDSLTPTAHHFISEEELFELLAELEMEMDAADLDDYEQMLALADVEERELEERILQYQHDEDLDGSDFHESVLCPLCTDALLRQEQNGAFVCPNTMDSSCDLNIPNQLGLTLPSFKDRLQEAYEQHAVYCSQNLSFQVGPCPPNEAMHLFAICIPCETKMLIL
ncbi:hypothetical protein FisN_1Hu238 [Fistulifera solaris]|uniref:RPA-interacting protein C-terminal domain-containing protein n=1 Tax=Fistulifera solaris TaxID=1519565 RepID=A0A1Z5JED2_FISSO|nr:hypothetical protein FisN_1Hu238 [Fistulifera solaris]|eukprot:GAX12306.1 hypothetical protein FisN_1Hu238 [Fistulifera solaris]